jgi:hypothetical protein
VVEELADRDAFREWRGITIELEQPFRDELEDERGDEELRHAPDPEAMIDRQRLVCSYVCNAGRCVNPPFRPERYCNGTRNAGRDNDFELSLDRFHLAGGEPNTLRMLSWLQGQATPSSSPSPVERFESCPVRSIRLMSN